MKGIRAEFDFYLPDQNICIEYDGIQHFEPVKYFGGLPKFIIQQRRDKAKDKYCIDNNIRLLRIAYNEDITSAIKSLQLL